jgi:hypothetical protein
MRHVSVVVVIAAGIISPAYAELKGAVPATVCASLQAVGLSTPRGWRKQYDTFVCVSPSKELGAGNPLANTLAFNAEGEPAKVKKAELALNVNVRASAAAAHRELLKASEMLGLAVTGKRLPPAVAAAITAGRKASAKVGQSLIVVTRDDWPTGKGYDIQVTFR